MVTNTLTEDLIKGGESLLKELDASDVKVDAAFWYYFPDSEFWKLMFSFPGIEKRGPKEAYSKIQKALSKIKTTNAPTLNQVAIVKPNMPILQLLRMVVRTGPGISSIRLTNNVINGLLIPDAYIYRL